MNLTKEKIDEMMVTANETLKAAHADELLQNVFSQTYRRFLELQLKPSQIEAICHSMLSATAYFSGQDPINHLMEYVTYMLEVSGRGKVMKVEIPQEEQERVLN